jgi:hypothetical protein
LGVGALATAPFSLHTALKFSTSFLCWERQPRAMSSTSTAADILGQLLMLGSSLLATNVYDDVFRARRM